MLQPSIFSIKSSHLQTPKWTGGCMQIKVFLNQLVHSSKPRPLIHSVLKLCETDIAHSQHLPFYSGGQAGVLECTSKVLISSCLSEIVIQGLAVPEALSATFSVDSGYAFCLMVLRYDFKVLYLEYLVFRTT